jgi:hypothetical protein
LLGETSLRDLAFRGNVVRGNVVRGNIIRGTVVRGTVVRGNAIRGNSAVPGSTLFFIMDNRLWQKIVPIAGTGIVLSLHSA